QITYKWQYLVVGQLLIQELEWPGHQGALSRTLGEQIVQTEETLHGNQEESRQEKETLSGRMLVQNSPRASQEKHLLRGFSIERRGLQGNPPSSNLPDS